MTKTVRIIVYGARDDEGNTGINDIFEMTNPTREDWYHWYGVARDRSRKSDRDRIEFKTHDEFWVKKTPRQLKILRCRYIVNRIAEMKKELREELDY